MHKVFVKPVDGS